MEATFETLPVTALTSRIYARIRSELRRKGRPIPANDLWIAAQAVEHGLPLVSRDAHFLNVKGLTLVSWCCHCVPRTIHALAALEKTWSVGFQADMTRIGGFSRL
jgi:hypothetical protein